MRCCNALTSNGKQRRKAVPVAANLDFAGNFAHGRLKEAYWLHPHLSASQYCALLLSSSCCVVILLKLSTTTHTERQIVAPFLLYLRYSSIKKQTQQEYNPRPILAFRPQVSGGLQLWGVDLHSSDLEYLAGFPGENHSPWNRNIDESDSEVSPEVCGRRIQIGRTPVEMAQHDGFEPGGAVAGAFVQFPSV